MQIKYANLRKQKSIVYQNLNYNNIIPFFIDYKFFKNKST